MTEYNKISEGYYTSTGVNKIIKLGYLPNSFEVWNQTAWATTTANLITHAWSWADATAGTALVEIINGTPALQNYALASGGITFINAGTYQYGPTLTITGVTQASAAVVTTSGVHNLNTGDAVQIWGTTAMLQISPAAYTVTVLSTTTFSIPVNSSGFAAAATAGFCKKILYPDLYKPQGTNITAISTGSTTAVTTALNHNFVVGQEVFFVIPTVSTTAWGTTQLDTATYNKQNVVPQQAYVTAITANTITVNVNSTGYTAFAFPTSAQAALGMTFPQVYAIGDQNFGQSGILVPIANSSLLVPGAWYADTFFGVQIGIGDGTRLLQQNGDVIRWRATFPDQVN